jgi:hypothetical protein
LLLGAIAAVAVAPTVPAAAEEAGTVEATVTVDARPVSHRHSSARGFPADFVDPP